MAGKAQAGRPVQVSAAQWNQFVDASQRIANAQFDQRGNTSSANRNADLIRVRNDTGADLARFSIVGLDAPLFGPDDSLQSFQNLIVLKGVEPAASHAGRFAVLLEPVADGKIARAWISGVCLAKVNKASGSHKWADVDAGETGRLASGSRGAAQILWSESGTGEKWAIVRLGATSGEPRIARTTLGMAAAVIDDDELSPGSDTITFYDQTETGWVLGTETAYGYNALPGVGTVAADTVVIVAEINGRWVVIAEACEDD